MRSGRSPWLVLRAAGLVTLAVIAAPAVGRLTRILLQSPAGFGGASWLGTVTVAVGFVAMLAALAAAVRWRGVSARAALVAGLLLAVGTRALAAVALDAPVDRDMVAYDQLASQVLAGGDPWSDRPMGYPYLLAGAYGLVGRGALAGEILNIALAALGGVALWRIARRYGGPRAASVALVLYAVWPAGVLMTTVRLTETMYATSLLWAVAAAVAPPGVGRSALAGGLLAVSHYVRPTSIFLLPAIVLPRLLPCRGTRVAAAAGAACALTFAAVTVPVIAHNQERYGELSPSTSAYGGWSLWVGTNAEHGGRWNVDDWEALFALTEGPVWEDSRVAGRLAMERIRADPLGTAALAVRKVPTLWSSEDYGIDFAVAGGAAASEPWLLPRLAAQAFYAVVTVAAAIGIARAGRRAARVPLVIVAITVTVAALHTLVEVRDRYHAYLVPLFIILAAPPLARLVERLAPRRRVSRDGVGRPAAPDVATT